MRPGIATARVIAIAALTAVRLAFAQLPPMASDQPEFVQRGQQLIREGKPDEALSLYQTILKADPQSLPALNAAGVVLDLMGRGEEARPYFQKAIDAAPGGPRKANAQRAMAMSWAFSGDCGQTVKYEQMAIAYYMTAKDSYQQGEIADEAARVCLDSGDLDTAYQWYLTGHDLGLKQPDIPADRKDLWEYRWEHAQARVAARKGNQTEAGQHVTAAKAILEKNPELARDQAIFLPYLEGYVAFYRGDDETALAKLAKANRNDPFIQCLMAQADERMGKADEAKALYRKAAETTAHNPPAAYARPFARKKLAPPKADSK